MIRLYRLRTEDAIPPAFRGTKRIAYNVELLKMQRGKACNSAYNFVFLEIWGKAKPQLMKETHYKCAYCERGIGTSDKKGEQATSYADVEHYRPKKGGYTWLAYCYDNYLYACEVCNRSYKTDFPTLKNKYEGIPINDSTTNVEIIALAPYITPDPFTENEGMPWADFEQAHILERPLLLNPYYDNPEDFLGYEYDHNLKEVCIFVLTSVSHYKQYQIALEKYYGLNRKDLRTDRYSHFEHFSTYKKLLKANISDESNQICSDAISRMKQDNYPYSGMIRYFDKILK